MSWWSAARQVAVARSNERDTSRHRPCPEQPVGNGPVALSARRREQLERHRVPQQAFRTAELRAHGGWNEQLPTNQDFDLNRRMGAHGLVWFDARLVVGYEPRDEGAPDLRAVSPFRAMEGALLAAHGRSAGDLDSWAVLVGAVVGSTALVAFGPYEPPVDGSRQWRDRAAGSRAGRSSPRGRTPRRGAATPRERVVSVSTLAAVWAGWVSGVYRELLAVFGRS